jgi:hypothetical protein
LSPNWNVAGLRQSVVSRSDEPDDWLTEVRKFARAKVIAEGWTDADIDRVIKEQREAVRKRRG